MKNEYLIQTVKNKVDNWELDDSRSKHNGLVYRKLFIVPEDLCSNFYNMNLCECKAVLYDNCEIYIAFYSIDDYSITLASEGFESPRTEVVLETAKAFSDLLLDLSDNYIPSLARLKRIANIYSLRVSGI